MARAPREGDTSKWRTLSRLAVKELFASSRCRIVSCNDRSVPRLLPGSLIRFDRHASRRELGFFFSSRGDLFVTLDHRLFDVVLYVQKKYNRKLTKSSVIQRASSWLDYKPFTRVDEKTARRFTGLSLAPLYSWLTTDPDVGCRARLFTAATDLVVSCVRRRAQSPGAD